MSEATTAATATDDSGQAPCPCGSGARGDDCCLRYHRGAAKPPTAEALMRSRYSAYVVGNIEWLLTTHDPQSPEETDEAWTRKWSKEATWLGLEVVETVAGGVEDEIGQVEFRARYQMQNNAFIHHERARFRKADGEWVYVDGDMVKQQPIVRDQPKVGRNDPCPCGSEKKYKKCHGAA